MSASAGFWLRRVLKGLAVAFLLAAALGFSYEQIGQWQDSHHPFRVGRSVDIGGRSLNIDCAGSGSPAVILEAGGGGYGGYGWRMVQSGGQRLHDGLLVRPRWRGVERPAAQHATAQ